MKLTLKQPVKRKKKVVIPKNDQRILRLAISLRKIQIRI